MLCPFFPFIFAGRNSQRQLQDAVYRRKEAPNEKDPLSDCVHGLISTSTTYAQTLMDYVLAQRGDPLVIKNYADMGGKPGTLHHAHLLNTVNLNPA